MQNVAEPVDKGEARIRGMFAGIAPWYDFLNHFLSLNIDKRWRSTTVMRVPLTTGPLLDVCTGTGDLALEYRKRSAKSVHIVGSDFCGPMLARAKIKGDKKHADIDFIEADAQLLPFADDLFEVVTVAFGLRNVTDPKRGLAEMVRVAKPGGRVAILEFSKPRNRVLGKAYQTYFKHVLPRVGQALSKSKDDAYKYLPASVAQFPDGEALAAWMRGAGLRDVTIEPLTVGIATLYVGRKPD